jgi:hypothetical protein
MLVVTEDWVPEATSIYTEEPAQVMQTQQEMGQ